MKNIFQNKNKTPHHFFSIKKSGEGFTMFELLIVIALIGIMISIALASFNMVRQKSRDGERLSIVKDIALALQDFYSQCGSYPNSIDPSEQSNVEPCPLRPDAGVTFVGPAVLERATFVSGSPAFRIPLYGEHDFFYVPTQTEVDGDSAIDSCDGYHIGVELETKDRTLMQDDDLDSDGSSITFNGVDRVVCFFANSNSGYDGVDDDGDASTVYDIVR